MERSSRYCKLTYEEIAERYLSGQSSAEISAAAGVMSRSVTRILNKLNVEMRPRGSWKRKHTLNEDYFKHWSNKMAYLLGFFVADGCVSGELQTISFSQNDKAILEDIRNELGSTHKIYFNEKINVYTLYLHSKIMKTDLVDLHGIQPNKSKTIEFPHIPDQYISHFIRGLFDGDGHLYRTKYYICFVGGSKAFMVKLCQILNGFNFNSKVVQTSSYYRVYVSGKDDVKRFGEWIYTNKSLYLDRKYKAFGIEN
ncbi:LAGLIDADG family homing endonuclease [Alkalihalophilus pseudofirmus]|uniref:LAGLIDADG family homing endonuclease n=1 Tax=Alkalihalophilus pseudofirmus TaxID=79885 RepID=UPI00259B68DA|nr:LAGLIDADG family homing endonuclease [Alkalihalophilus pseudofirmus]WEG18714.1 LAGLIDADG family homing endonuclease [Alkalihalophilus pseudofirmus]